MRDSFPSKCQDMNSIVAYVKESYNELLHNVTWPTMSELLSSARVVLVSTVILALIILLMDTVLSYVVLDGFLYQINAN